MQVYNCIMVYNQTRDRLLFCKRLYDPYEGQYNLVGGKREPGESGFDADAVSSVGAVGLMQLTPDTFEWVQKRLDGSVSYDRQ